MDGDQAVAIVGIGFKGPGADDIYEFWNVLKNGEDHVVEIPPERWNNEAFYSDDPDKPGKTYVKKAGLIKSFDEWDNNLFDINDTEAERIDPQQRYVLDCVHMALEDGGITRRTLNRSRTSVFIGTLNHDYLVQTVADPKTMTHYTLTGSAPTLIAERVSYVYNLHGASMCIDTACSSSLVAIDLGIMHLKLGRCSMAICGGVNCMLYPETFIPLTKARMVSPDGKCRTFADNANGYARGEGCGIVILKPLKRALDDRNKIWATIVTCCNQDGHTATPVTAPSESQQIALLKEIYTSNGIDPQDIQVIEAHGTGTQVGDTIEAKSLGQVLGNGSGKRVKYIASVKTNIGHLEAAAGVTGVIKILLMMKHQLIVASLHCGRLNNTLDFEAFNFRVPTENIIWRFDNKSERLACVNAFGFAGTNAHAILKEHKNSDGLVNESERQSLIFLTALTLPGLVKVFDKFIKNLSFTTERLSDISYTSLCLRDHFQYRTAILANGKSDLINKCKQRRDILADKSKCDVVADKNKINITAVFCGVGTTWKGMCQELLKDTTVSTVVADIDRELSKYTQESVMDILLNGKDPSNPLMSHLLIFTCQIALWHLWCHWGITIDKVIGQSVGEVAAAYAAGCLSFETAVKVVYYRSKLLSEVKSGKMFVVLECDIDNIESICRKFGNRASIAVYNSPSSCTISCDDDILSDLQAEFKKYTTFIQNLSVPCSYHSHHTLQASLELEKALEGITAEKTKIPQLSTVTGKFENKTTFANPRYWGDNVFKPVLFQNAIETAAAKDNRATQVKTVFLEIGPQQVLQSHIKDIFRNRNDIYCFPSMMRNAEDGTLLSTVGKLFELGITLNWKDVHKGHKGISPIPCYAFNTRKGLFESNITKQKRHGIKPRNLSHLFVQPETEGGIKFIININAESTLFVYHHLVDEKICVPGALYAEVALEVGRQAFGRRLQDLIVSVNFVRLLSLANYQPCTAKVIVENVCTNKATGVIINNDSTVAEFTISIQNCIPTLHRVDLDELLILCGNKKMSYDFYDMLIVSGFRVEEQFKIIGDVYKGNSLCLVKLNIPDIVWNDVDATHLHPSILDALLQTAVVLMSSSTENRPCLPTRISQLRVLRVPERQMYGYVEITKETEREICFNIILLADNGNVIAEMKGFTIRYLNAIKPETMTLFLCVREIDHFSHSGRKHEQEQRNQIILVSFNEKILQDFHEIPQFSDTEILLLRKKSPLHVLKQDIELRLNSNPRVQSICYIPGFCISNLNCEQVCETVLLSCMTLNAILQIIDSGNRNLNVTIITENTQVIDIQKQTHANPLGSELWGQVRSILWESDRFKIYLLDVHGSIGDTKDFICHFLENCSNISHAELIYSNRKLFTYTLKQQERESVNKYRETAMDKDCKVVLKSCSWNNIETAQTYCVLQTSAVNEHHDGVSILTEQVSLHSAKLIDVTVQTNIRTSSIWTETNELDVITYEVTGHALTGSQDQTLVVFYPTKVQSYISVPSECTYRLNQLPGYRPGMVVVTALMLAIRDVVPDDLPVNIICSNDNGFAGKLLQFALKENLPNTEIAINKKIGLQKMTCVLLDDVNKHTIDEIVSKCVAKRIVCLSTLINSKVKMFLKFKNISTVTVHSENILERDTICRLAPQIFKWLQSHLERIVYEFDPVTVNKDNALSVPFHTISLKSADSVFQTVKSPVDSLFRTDGTYVVVGGFTGLGWVLVQYIAQNGAGEVIILSRRNLPADKKQDLDKLKRETGCHYRTFATDVSNWIELNETFRQIEDTSFYLKGIFHGAVILHDALFKNISEDLFTTVIKPKVAGIWNLHILSQKYPLDYFVANSSITSVFGNEGQSSYGAANAFMDSVIYYRRQRGLCGHTINWGPLSLGVLTDTTEKDLKSKGYTALKSPEIISSFKKCLQSNEVQMIAMNVDWKIMAVHLSSNENKSLKDKCDALQLVSFISNEKIIFPANFTPDDVSDIVLKTMQDVCNHRSSELIGPNTTIQELGLDSMQAMTFVSKTYDITGYKLRIKSLFVGDTRLSEIIQNLQDNMFSKEQDNKNKENSIDLTITSSMTMYEKICYDSFKHNPNDFSLIIYADLEVYIKHTDLDDFKKLVENVKNKYAGLRTIFVPNQEEIRFKIGRKVLSRENSHIDLSVVSTDELSNKEPLPQKRELYVFDPSKDSPLRIFIAIEQEMCLIRFVFNHIFVDFFSIRLLMSDFMSRKVMIDPDPQEVDSKDIAVLVENKLISERELLHTFWNLHTPKDVHPMSIKPNVRSVLNPDCFNFTRVTVDTNMAKSISAFLAQTKVTLFTFTVSVFQLLLHIQLGVETVTVYSDIDMRMHFPELSRTVGKLTNPIPLYACINKEADIKTFIEENHKKIIEAIEHSVLPFQNIVNCIKNIDPSEVMQHSLQMEDISSWHFRDDDDRHTVKLRRVVTGGYDHESGLLVWHDMRRSKLELELFYNTIAISDDFAQQLLMKITNIIGNILTRSNLKLCDLFKLVRKDADGTEMNIFNDPHEMLKTQVAIPNTECLLSDVNTVEPLAEGQFMLTETKDNVWVTLEQKTIQRGIALNWGKEKRNPTRRLFLVDVHSIEFRNENELFCMCIWSSYLEYVFKTGDWKITEQFKSAFDKCKDDMNLSPLQY